MFEPAAGFSALTGDRDVKPDRESPPTPYAASATLRPRVPLVVALVVHLLGSPSTGVGCCGVFVVALGA